MTKAAPEMGSGDRFKIVPRAKNTAAPRAKRTPGSFPPSIEKPDISVRVHCRLLGAGPDQIRVAAIGPRNAQRVLVVFRKRLVCLGGVETGTSRPLIDDQQASIVIGRAGRGDSQARVQSLAKWLNRRSLQGNSPEDNGREC